MAKRFTATEKWDDAWFVSLTPTQKLAWFYLCDRCDLAGVIDLAVALAEFHLGGPFDWDEFIAASDGRIVRCGNGKLHLTRFVEWQYGELSESCNAHKAVLKALAKHEASGTLSDSSVKGSEPLADSSLRVQDKDKDKDKDKDQKEGGMGETKRPRAAVETQIPAKFSLPIREKLAEWLRYKAEIGNRYKPTGLQAFFGKVANAIRNYGESQVIASIDDCMANGWKGWDHSLGKARGSPEPIDRREAEILKATREMEARNGPRQPQPRDQHLLCDHRGPDP